MNNFLKIKQSSFIFVKERWYHRFLSKLTKKTDYSGMIPVGVVQVTNTLHVDMRGRIHVEINSNNAKTWS